MYICIYICFHKVQVSKMHQILETADPALIQSARWCCHWVYKVWPLVTASTRAWRLWGSPKTFPPWPSVHRFSAAWRSASDPKWLAGISPLIADDVHMTGSFHFLFRLGWVELPSATSHSRVTIWGQVGEFRSPIFCSPRGCVWKLVTPQSIGVSVYHHFPHLDIHLGVYPIFRRRHSPLELWTFDAHSKNIWILREQFATSQFLVSLFCEKVGVFNRSRSSRWGAPHSQEVALPEGLQTLTLGESFNQSLSGVAVPPSSWVRKGRKISMDKKPNHKPFIVQTCWDLTWFNHFVLSGKSGNLPKWWIDLPGCGQNRFPQVRMATPWLCRNQSLVFQDQNDKMPRFPHV